MKQLLFLPGFISCTDSESSYSLFAMLEMLGHFRLVKKETLAIWSNSPAY
jgi:hypothetical protein